MAGWDHRMGESQPVGFLDPLVDAGNRPDLTGQAHLAEGDQPDRERFTGLGRGHGQGNGQVSGGLAELHAAHCCHVGIILVQLGSGALLQHGQEHGHP